jgi:hypothetical protein
MAAGREGLEVHVREMLEATCSANGKWEPRHIYNREGA